MSEKIDFVVPKRTKLKPADWPLSSKNPHQSLKHDMLAHSKEITLIVEKGTKRSSCVRNLRSLVEKNTEFYSSEKHVCDTCKEEILDISRILIMRDKDSGPRLLFYHFFFPCWDMNLLCQQYPNLVIDRIGFSFNEDVQIKQSSIEHMQKNFELWS
jgi:hypothetical protein